MHGRLTTGVALLRAIGFGALILLLWNPASTHRLPASEPPLVLLDASLSMIGYGARWPQALDTARRLARGGIVWRFGTNVTEARGAFDSLAPADGETRLAPALAAAAARGGTVIVVTDGVLDDAPQIPPDLLRMPGIVIEPRAPFTDRFVAAVEGPNRVTPTDTLRLRVSYGVAGPREAGSGKREARLSASVDRKQVALQKVQLPDSGIVSTELTLPASRFRIPDGTRFRCGSKA